MFPNKLKAYRVNDCTPLLQTYFTAEDLTIISVRQCGTAIRYNTQQLIALLAKLISISNINQIKQKLKWLNKFTQIDIPNLLIESIKISKNSDIIKFAAQNMKDIDYLAIVEYFHEQLNDTYFDSQALLQDGKVIMLVTNKSFFEKLKIHLQSTISKDTKLDEDHVIQILHYLQVNQETASSIISKYVWMNISNYDKLQNLVDQSIKLQQLQFVSSIQNQIEQCLKNDQLVFQLAEEIVEKGTHQFVQKFMLAKLNTMQLYQKCYLQMIVSQFVFNQRKYENANLEFIATLKYVDEIVVASNYYWNQGSVVLNIANPLQDVNLPICKVIQQKFSTLNRNHQVYQLLSVILHVEYKNKLLFMTPQEYQILQLFQKTNVSKITGDAMRLVNLGVLQQKAHEYQIIETNLDQLMKFQFASKPAPKKQEIQQEEYEQNKKLIIEAGVMKIMKHEKKMEFLILYQKVSSLIKKSVILTEIELQESLKGLVKRDLLCFENDIIFYNV